jgi:hypothetical protein
MIFEIWALRQQRPSQRVYVGTSNKLGAWGLTQFLYLQTAGTNTVLNWTTGTLLEATNLSGPWTTNSGVSPHTVQPTNTQMF